MSFFRVALFAVIGLSAAGASSVASAGCFGCGWGNPAPIAYAPVPSWYGPAIAPPVPVAPAPIAVDHWDTAGFCGGYGFCGGFAGCGFGGCGAFAGFAGCGFAGCGAFDGFGACGGCGGALAYVPPVVPSPLYVVNQGPAYTGPGIMVPYRTYSPAAALAPAINYPYIGRRYARPYYPRGVYYRRRVVYHTRPVPPPYYGPRPTWQYPR